jgi:hypothetical protein
VVVVVWARAAVKIKARTARREKVVFMSLTSPRGSAAATQKARRVKGPRSGFGVPSP